MISTKHVKTKLGEGRLMFNKEIFNKSPKEVILLEIDEPILEIGNKTFTMSYDTLAMSVENSNPLDCFFAVFISESGEYLGHSHPFYSSKIENEEDLIKFFEKGARNLDDESDNY